MFNFTQSEMLVMLVIVLLIFGPKNLPKLASSMGRAVKDFKAGLAGIDQQLDADEKAASHPVDTKAEIAGASASVDTPKVEAHQAAHSEKTEG